VLLWRLSIELRDGHAFSEDAERIASRNGGALLFALAVDVVIAAGYHLWMRYSEEFSLPGIAVTLSAIPIMRYFARRKIELANQLGSRTLRANAMESATCGWLVPFTQGG